MEHTFFKFEADFVDTLRCVPMIVRFKLDTVGIKLSLRAWSRFALAKLARGGHENANFLPALREFGLVV